MAFNKETKRTFLEITKEGIVEEACTLNRLTTADSLIRAANLAIQHLVGTIIQEEQENPSERLKMAQSEIWEILENTKTAVVICNLAEQYNNLKEELEEE